MRKRIFYVLVTFGFLLSCGLLYASPRGEQAALELASGFFAKNAHLRKAPAAHDSFSHAWTAIQTNGSPAFYVFNRGVDGGFVIVSAEDNTCDILGYADSGTFNKDEIPNNMRVWLKGYERAISNVSTLLPMSSNQTQRKLRAQKSYTPIAPICKTTWDQGHPYNLQCPSEGVLHCVTGCVATAAAQLMKCHNYPAHGKGYHSYEWKNNNGVASTLSADFENTSYDWSNMKNSYNASSTTTEKNAVATLMFHCGVACDMEYGLNASSAITSTMMSALISYFDYDKGIRALNKDYMSENDFLDAIITDLKAGRPVYFSARTPKDEGHAFICDGIDADGLIHINWGWNGTCNGYFLVSVLNPEEQGIGGSANNESYTENVSAYTQIRPNVYGKYIYTITSDEITISSKRISRNTAPEFMADCFCNMSISTWAGSYVLLVYKNGSLYKVAQGASGRKLDPGYYYTNPQTISADLSSLATGDYELVPAVSIDNQSNVYAPIYVKGIGEYRCPMTVTSSEIILLEPGEADDSEFDLKNYNLTKLNNFNYGNINGAWRWNLQFATEGFYQDSSSDELCVMFMVNARHDNSILGSFAIDGELDANCQGVSFFTGNINNYERVNADEGECTLVYHKTTDTYTLHYNILLNGKSLIGQLDMPTSAVVSSLVTDDGQEKIYLDNTLYTSLSATEADTRTRLLPADKPSAIPFVVEGEISELGNTPEQMALYKNCRFYVSDGKTSFYSYNTKWIDNTNFTTGNEITVGGKVAIVGSLLNYLGNTPEMKEGYICLYTAPKNEPLEYDAENMNYYENFNEYKTNYADEGWYVWVSAGNENNAALRICIILPYGATELVAGSYPIDTTLSYQSVYAGTGVDDENHIQGSYAGYFTSDGYISVPLWFLVNGTVTIDNDGNINVNATNSYGRTVRCIAGNKVNVDINAPQVACVMEQISVSCNREDDTGTPIWDFDGGIVSSGNGFGPYSVYWSSGGQKTITLTLNGQTYKHEIFIEDLHTLPVSLPTVLYEETPAFAFVPEGYMYEWRVSLNGGKSYQLITESGILDENRVSDGRLTANGLSITAHDVPGKPSLQDEDVQLLLYVSNSNGCGAVFDTAITVIMGVVNTVPTLTLVTTDTEGHNIVSWTDVEAFEMINIYKKSNITNDFQLIGSVAASSASFSDEDVTHKEEQYLLTGSTVSGIESSESAIHKTVHLSLERNVRDNTCKLTWNAYEGAVVTSYNVLRGSNPKFLSSIATLSSSTTSYNDRTLKEGQQYYYAIEYVLSTATNAPSVNHAPKAALTGRSNVADSTEKQQGIDQILDDNGEVHKLLIDGHIYIVRGDKIYSLTGQKMKSYY